MERGLTRIFDHQLSPVTPDRGLWLYLPLTTLLAAALGYSVSLEPGWLHLGFDPLQPSHLMGVMMAALGVLALVKWPRAGLLLLVAVIYGNVSEVALRYHDWPSLLQLMVVPLAIVLLGRPLLSDDRKLIGDGLFVLLSLYGIVLLASSLVATNPDLADEKSFDHFKNLFLFLLIINLAGTRGALKQAVWVLLAVGAVLGTISVHQVFTSSYGVDYGGFGRVKFAQVVGAVHHARIAGPLSDPNFYALILVPLVPMALYRLWDESSLRLKLASAYALGITLLALIFTYSRGGAIALALVLALTVVLDKTKLKYVFCGVLLVIPLALFLPQEFEGRLATLTQLIPGEEDSGVELDSSFQQRSLLMRTAWEGFSAHPILGLGAGNYSEHYREYAEQVGSTVSSYEEFDQRRFAHSLYLEIAAETGLLGLTLFAAIIVATLSTARTAIREFKESGDWATANLVTSLTLGFIAYLAASLFLHGHYIRYLWLIVALLVAAKKVAQQQKQPSMARTADGAQ